MNKKAAGLLATFVFAAAASPASLFDTQWISSRFHPQTAEVRPIEGLAGRVQNGKLTLDLKNFLALFLKNSTDVHIARLDVYTAADQTVAAADEADDPAQRANLLAQAEAQLTQANVYIPFGQPVRFTLVRARVTGFSPNQWVFHPLPPLASVTK